LKHLGSLTRMRILLAMRNKMFFFFIVIFPLGMFFVYSGIFAKGDPQAVRFFLGPVIALNVMGSFWGLSAALVMYREQGILRRFHVAPVTAIDLLASSVLANFILTLPIVITELALAHFLFHVRDMGNLLSLAVMVTAGTISFASLGLIVASVTNSMQETQVINQLIWLPLIFLSGATIPLGYLPGFVQHIAVYLPATYLVSGLQDAMMNARPIWRLPEQVLSLAVWACLAFFLASQLFRWEPEEKVPRNAKLWAVATIVPFLILGVWENKHGRLLIKARSAFQSLSQPAPPTENPNH
jgi:ABC-type multidrug transport system permease subunit